MAPLPAREVDAYATCGIADRPAFLVALGLDPTNARRPWLFVTGSPRTARSTGRRRSSASAEPPDRRSHEQLERHRRRNRVARQAEQQDRCPAARPRGGAERERFAGLDGDAPQVDVADRLEGRLDDVVRTDGDAARDDDRVDPVVERPTQAVEDIVELVPSDTEVDGSCARDGDERPKARTVGVGDAGRSEVLAGRADLVAGREDADTWMAVDEDLAEPGTGQERDGGGVMPLPGRSRTRLLR